MGKNKKLRAALSLDLDNEWSYLKIHGDPGWESLPSYFHIFIPYALDLFDELQIKVTFFIVGKDMTVKENLPYIKAIIDRGHSIANHSMNHESWLQTYTREQLYREVKETDDLIQQHTGQKPVGFRGPGFSWNPMLIGILNEMGYKYDTSMLPTFIGPLARMFYFRKSRLGKDDRKTRRELFGRFSDGFIRLKPFVIEDGDKRILEIPVTTMPLFRLPFHLSYLIYLNNISPVVMDIYLSIAIKLCKTFRIEPCFLLHPLDIIGGDQIRTISFFPGMNVSSSEKIHLFCKVINKLGKHFHLISLDIYGKKLYDIFFPKAE